MRKNKRVNRSCVSRQLRVKTGKESSSRSKMSSVGRRTSLKAVFVAVGHLVGTKAASSAKSANETDSETDNSTVTPFDCGATGDGNHDDTEACQQAINLAGQLGRTLFFPKGTYRISQYLRIERRIVAIDGDKDSRILIDGDDLGGIKLTSIAEEMKVRNLTLQYKSIRSWECAGIECQDVSNVTFIGIRIRARVLAYGIRLSTSPGSRRKSSTHNSIIDCDIEFADTKTPKGVVLALDGALEYSTSTQNARSLWLSEFRSAEVPSPILATDILRNRIIGGYYGIALSGASSSLISGNTVSSNMRNISIQNTSSDNTVVGNELSDSISSAIHLAYGSSRNICKKNHIRTSRASGEGLLQSYVGASDNRFEFNTVETIGSAIPKYFAYCGVQSDRVLFENNIFTGRCSRAFVAVESAFSSRVRLKLHRNYDAAPTNDYFARSGIAGTRILKNSISGIADGTVFLLTQVSDARGRYPIRDVRIEENSVSVKEGGRIVIYSDDPRQIHSIAICDNKFTSSLNRSDWVFPNKRVSAQELSRYCGNQ